MKKNALFILLIFACVSLVQASCQMPMLEDRDEIFEQQLSLVDMNTSLNISASAMPISPDDGRFQVAIYNESTEEYFLHPNGIVLFYFDAKNATWQETPISEVRIIPVSVTEVDVTNETPIVLEFSEGIIFDEKTTVTLEPNKQSTFIVIEPQDWSMVSSVGGVRVLIKAQNANSQASAYHDTVINAPWE